MNTHYVVFEGLHPFSKYVFKDLRSSPFCSFARIPSTGLLGKLNHFHTAEKLNRRLPIPFKSLWYERYVHAIPAANRYVFVFMEDCRQAYDAQFLLYLRKKFANVVLVYYFLNSAVELSSQRLHYIETNFDFIVSYDELDCTKRGWHHYSGVYCADNSIQPGVSSDVFFIGQNKGRLKTLQESYARFSGWGLKCDYFIIGVPSRLQGISGIHYNNPLPYTQTLQRTRGTRFLFENLQKGQSGCSFRTFEAIAYGKVLITNNDALKSMRIFDAGRVLLYHDVSEITLDAMRRCEQSTPCVSSADLSPDLFIAYLEKTINA